MKTLGLIILGVISGWLRWSSPEQEKKRKLARITKLDVKLDKMKKRRDELLGTQTPHSIDDTLELSNIVNNITRLREEISRLRRQ